MTPIGKSGRITKGESAGWYVIVQDDSASTGGFLILTARDAEFTDGFDNWVESRDALDQFFEESQWQVIWFDS